MELLKSFFSKNAKHFLQISVCFIMATGLFSCNNDDVSLNSTDCPTSTDDASLLAWQMEEMVKTRGASFDVALVTTGTNFEFGYLIGNRDYSIDWGDGVIENNTKSHTYTDGLAAHTIYIYGDFNGYGSKIHANMQNLIYADISRCPGLKDFDVANNRLTNVDLYKNTGLEFLSIAQNNLSSLDLSNVLNLNYLSIGNNSITKIDVTKFPHLQYLYAKGTLIQSINLSNNKELMVLDIRDSPITKIDIKNCPVLVNFSCSNCPIDEIDFSQNTIISVLYCDGTNITDLDISKVKGLGALCCKDCKINNITIYSEANSLLDVDIRNNPIEQNIRKMTNFALSLPDRSGRISGTLETSTPYLSTVSSLLEDYNWEINPQ